MFQKKSHPIKIKINYHAQALKNQKKKKRRKKRGNVNAQEKKKMTTGNVIAPPPSPQKNVKRGATLLPICVKCIFQYFSLFISLPNWEDKKMWVWREKFPPFFLSFLFSLFNQTVENVIFQPIFLFLFSIIPIFTPTKYTLRVIRIHLKR